MPFLQTFDMDKPDADKKTQHQRFVETARELECDEDEAAFDEKLRRIATVKPKPQPQAKPGRKR